MTRSLMLPAVIGVAVLGMVLGLMLSGVGGGPGSPRVLYINSQGQVTDSGFTVASLAGKIKSPAAADSGGGKLKLSGETLEFVLKPYAQGHMLVESLTTSRGIPTMQMTPNGIQLQPAKARIDPAMIFAGWAN